MTINRHTDSRIHVSRVDPVAAAAGKDDVMTSQYCARQSSLQDCSVSTSAIGPMQTLEKNFDLELDL